MILNKRNNKLLKLIQLFIAMIKHKLKPLARPPSHLKRSKLLIRINPLREKLV